MSDRVHKRRRALRTRRPGTQLHLTRLQACVAESERRTVESLWRNTELDLTHARQALGKAQLQWQQV